MPQQFAQQGSTMQYGGMKPGTVMGTQFAQNMGTQFAQQGVSGVQYAQQPARVGPTQSVQYAQPSSNVQYQQPGMVATPQFTTQVPATVQQYAVTQPSSTPAVQQSSMQTAAASTTVRDDLHSSSHTEHHASSRIVECVTTKGNPEEGGIGLVFVDGIQQGRIGVLTLVTNGPAEADGRIRVGDLVSSVDGVPVVGWSLENVRRVIIGRAGTQCTVSFDRPSSQSNFSVTLTRQSSAQIERSTTLLMERLKVSESTAIRERETRTSVEQENTRLRQELQRAQNADGQEAHAIQNELRQEIRTIQAEHSREISVLTRERDDAFRQRDDALDNLERERDREADVQAQAHSLVNQARQLKSEAVSEHEALMRCERERDRLEEELNDLKARMQANEQSMQRSHVQQIRELEERCMRLERSEREFNERLDAEHRERDRVEDALRQVSRERDALRTQLNEVTVALDSEHRARLIDQQARRATEEAALKATIC